MLTYRWCWWWKRPTLRDSDVDSVSKILVWDQAPTPATQDRLFLVNSSLSTYGFIPPSGRLSMDLPAAASIALASYEVPREPPGSSSPPPWPSFLPVPLGPPAGMNLAHVQLRVSLLGSSICQAVLRHGSLGQSWQDPSHCRVAAYTDRGCRGVAPRGAHSLCLRNIANPVARNMLRTARFS